MGYKIFISHSVNPQELAIVYSLAEEASKQGITPFIPDRNWSLQGAIPNRILAPLRESDAMVVVGTKFGIHSHFVSAEMRGFDKNKPLLSLLDPEVSLSGIQPVNRIKIDRLDMAGTIFQASQQLKSMQIAKTGKDALTWLVVGGLLFMLFQESK
jgi:hypothetical protein